MITACSHQDSHNTSSKNLRVATFNVSMEGLNYLPYDKTRSTKADGSELNKALLSDHQQIKNIAEIIQRINPDIILLNEFDRTNEEHKNIKLFLTNYLAKSQANQQAINYPFLYQGAVNTGVVVDNVKTGDKQELHGYGHFPGHFGMVLLSKYPIDHDNVRTFQHFKWKDMPSALKPVNEDNSSYYPEDVWNELRLSSKSHWDIPVNVNGKQVHILASHPTPPVFDGPEDRNGKRNHDEIRFWLDYIDQSNSQYIYDDNGTYGGLASNSPFVILGDQNASAVEGDAINTSITQLLSSAKVIDPKPSSQGASEHSADNPHGPYHTAYWRMRADYVLPSKVGFNLLGSGVFWPSKTDESYRLIKDRQASSDHRMVWVDVALTQ